MKKKLNLSLMLLCLSIAVPAQQLADYHVVPKPKTIIMDGNTPPCPLSSIKHISIDSRNDLHTEAALLADYLKELTGRSLPVVSEKKRSPGSIRLHTDTRLPHPEGYRMEVRKDGIDMAGGTPAGVFYAIQALRKALPAAPADSILLPTGTVADAPRFSYRGMHLDICRHFFGPEFVKQYLDMMALHGMNTLHWHITDDQGWRIEIKKYPLLTETGAWRSGTVIGRNTGLYDNQRYGGFFTQDEARDIVRYAADRHITVIPEIDMPGHMTAALAAYPQYGCTGGPYEVVREWGVFDEILCAGNDSVYTFINDILDELIDIFPSAYIHLGGDEAPRTRWKECRRCQQRIRDEHLADADGQHGEDHLQGYFIRRIEKHMRERGRKIIGWDELMDCNVDSSATIMSWRGTEGGIAAAERGHDVIMVPTSVAYFDYYQKPESDWSKPLLIGGYVPIEKVYDFEPAPDSLSFSTRRHIIGTQANLWTEYITCKELAEYQLLPRMAALAETQWAAPDAKDYGDFSRRLPQLLRLYGQQGWKYCR